MDSGRILYVLHELYVHQEHLFDSKMEGRCHDSPEWTAFSLLLPENGEDLQAKEEIEERKEHTIAESKQKQEKRVISDANSYLLYGHSIEITDDVLFSERRFLWTIDGGIQFTYRRKNLWKKLIILSFLDDTIGIY